MRRLGPLLLLAALAAASPGAAAARTGGCAPSRLQVQREPGRATARLTWRAPGSTGRFRVLRDGRVLGVTARRSLPMRVKVGRRYRFVVVALRTGCRARRTISVRAKAPAVPRGVAVTGVTETGATLTWLAARRGDGRLGGYRVQRDGKVVSQTRRLSLRVKLTPRRTHELAVRAVDTRGRRSAVSRRIRVAPGHAGPSAPAGLTVTGTSSSTVGLAWEASSVAAGRVVGYRVARNGAPLFQTAATSATAASLAASTTYTFTVAAVDGHGYLGPPSAPVSATTVDPAPATGGLHAFLLATTDRSFEDLQAHYDRIGTLYPTYFDCRADGRISGREDPLVTRYAQQRRIAVLPRYNCQNGAVVHTILTNPQIRAATLANLAALVDAHGYDGLNLDFESGYATDRAALTGYVADLAALLHARGKRLSVDVSAKTADAPTGRAAFYDYPAIAEHADHVFVMNWGKHWSTSAPGAMDDLPWARAVADHVAAMPHRERFVLGFPLYGMDWAAGGGAAHPGEPMEHARLQGLLAAVGAAPVLDPVAGSWHFSYTDGAGVGHEVWYGDATTFAQRIALARDRGLGVGVWRLGSEDQRLWDLPGLAAP